MAEHLSQTLIRTLERITRTDFRYLFRGLFWFGVQHVLLAGGALASAVVFANFLPKETYGVYRYVLSIFAILTISNITRIDDSLAISVAKGFEGDFLRVLKVRMRWGLLGAAAGMALAAYWFLNNNLLLAGLAAIMSVFVPFLEPPTTYNGFLIGRKNFKKLSLVAVANNVVHTVVIIAAVFATKQIVYILTVYFVANTISRMLSLAYVLSTERPNTAIEPRTVSYGKRLSVIDILAVVSGHIDSILLFHYLGAAELAAYTFIKRVPEHIKVIPKYVTALSTPKFSTKDISDPAVKKTLLRKSAALFFALLAAALVYIIAAPWLFRFLFAPYQEYVRLSQLYALSMPLNFAGLFFNFIETSRKERVVAQLGFISPLLRIAVIVVSLKFFGLTGLVAGFLFTRFAVSLLRLFFFYRA